MQHNYLHYHTKKNTVLCCNNKYYLQWGTNTTKIQIRISLTVHWYIYNTFLVLLAKLLHRREREKEKKNYIYKYVNEKKREIKVEVCMTLPLHVD